MKRLALALVVLLSATACSSAQPATSSAKESNALGNNLNASGLPSWEFQATVSPDYFGIQRKTNWCWAATSQMLLNWYGIPATQEQLVTKLFGGLIDQPATNQQIRSALDGWAFNSAGGTSLVQSYEPSMDDATIIRDLHERNPMIVGLANPNGGTGHAYILYAVSWYYDAYGYAHIYQAYLQNPWPGEGVNVMSWQEVQQRSFGMTEIRVVH